MHDFPSSGWSLYDYSNDSCEYLWDDDDFQHNSGSWAGWPANGGANGLDPASSNYPPNMNSWMIYGPFDLSNATDADTIFYLWREIETTYDYVFFGVSGDGTNFNGYSWDGTQGWTFLDVYYTDYVGDSSVWVAWVFSSDSSVNLDGPWVDDVSIWKYTGPYCGPYAGQSESAQIPIPDNGTWLEVPVHGDAMQAGDILSIVNVKYLIDHPTPQELEVRLLKDNGETGVMLWDHGVAAMGAEWGTALGIDAFAGLPAEGIWRLQVRDTVPGQQGLLNAVSVRVQLTPTGPMPEIRSGPTGQPMSLRLPEDAYEHSGVVGDPVPESDIGQLPSGMDHGQPEAWEVIEAEDFEGVFPGTGWSLLDLSDDGCEFLWNDDDYRPYNGSWAGWPANGGANGLDPASSNYPPNMNSWMVYGPFDLSDANDADTWFNMWREIETGLDYVFFGVSNDGSTFNGYAWDGSQDWTWLDVYYTDYVGDSSVWVAWMFSSDGSVQYEGPWVDEVVIWKNTGGLYDCATGDPVLSMADARLTPEELRSHTGSVDVHQPEGPYEIQLKSRFFIPPDRPSAEELDRVVQKAAELREVGKDRVHILLQLNDMPTLADVDRLAELGIHLLAYVPDRAWLASVDVERAEIVRQLDNLRWVELLQFEDKVSPSLLRTLEATREDELAYLTVYFFNDTLPASAKAILGAHNATVSSSVPERSRYDVLILESEIPLLVEEDALQWLEFAPPEKVVLNECVRWRTEVDSIQTEPYNLSGSNVDLGIWDGGRVDGHTDFSGRLTIVDTSATVGDHATHVAGTMAGDGALSQDNGGAPNQWKGMAPGSDIFSYYWDNPITDHDGAINTYGIEISQNSWGYGVDSSNCWLYGDYASDAPEFDDIVTGLYGDRIVVVFAAGNERDDGDCGMDSNPPYLNYANISPPATAKNVIAVGATNSNDDSMTDFSSWGPLDDGRVKPDLVAPGCESLQVENYVHSTLPGNTYGGPDWCGTSMAAPAVSGISALLIEQYRSTFGVDPLPSTIKGLLIHSATDLDDGSIFYNPGPDYASGYGRVNAQAAVDIVNAQRVREDALANGESDLFTVEVPYGTPFLKITLVWDDEPGTPNANPALVNNLDLWLEEPNGNIIHRPWILDAAQPANDAQRGIDTTNNVEQVYVGGPASGTWLVYVVGTSVIPGDQNYTILGSSPILVSPPQSPSPQSPTNGSSHNEGTSFTLVWNSSPGANEYYAEYWGGPAGTISSGWQAGTSWFIGSQWAGYTYSWHVKARNAGGESSWSDTWTFTVRPGAPSNLSAEAVSCNQVNLSWTDNSGSEEGYKIYRDGSLIGQVGMDITTYQDTSVNENTTYSYYVKAFRGGIESDPSNTANVTTPLCNDPPYTPNNPSPVDGATNQSINVDLGWSGSDPDPGDTVTYDVYFEAGDSTPDVLTCDNAYSPVCDPGTLSYSTQYFWQVIATDNHGSSTTGPVWNLTIEPPTNQPPVANDDTDTVAKGGSVTTDVLANDSDPDNPNSELTVGIVTAPLWGTATVQADGTITYAHDGSETTADSYVYQICDPDGLCDTATVAITITPEQIFADGFESGDLSAWTSNKNDSGDLSVSTAAALVGAYGMQAVLDDNVAIYVTDDTPNAEPRYRARFYFDPNSLSMASGNAHYIFFGYSGTTTMVLRVEFRYYNLSYQIRVGLINDSSIWRNSSWFTISDDQHFIELDWMAATTVGANDGYLTLWIDEVQKANLTGVDNDTRRIDRVRLGAVTGIDSGTRGTYYLDAFESRSSSYIGPGKITADFSADKTAGMAPLNVNFTNLSEPDWLITSYLWDFGDGITSTLSDPSHTYTATGHFTVTLTAIGLTDQDTITKVSYVNTTEYIFSDGFESGDFSAWTSVQDDFGDLSVGPPGLVGDYAMQALIDDNNAIFVTDETPDSESRYRARFYFDPKSIPMVNGDNHFLFYGYSGNSTVVLRLHFRYYNGSYQIGVSLLDDSTTWKSSRYLTISDGPHAIELDWRSATAVGANDGYLTLWIDGMQRANLTGVDNDTRKIDQVRLGAVAGIDSGTRGTYFFDDFVSRRETYIGP